MKLAFFGFTWNLAQVLDAYSSEIVSGLSKLGYDVDVYNGSKFTEQYGIYGLKSTISINKLETFITKNEYDAAISFNNSLLMPETINSVGGHVVSVMIDQVEHLFNHRSRWRYDPFNYDIDYVAMSSNIQREILDEVPRTKGRVHLIPPATNIIRQSKNVAVEQNNINISWVASLLGDQNIEQYMNIMTEIPEGYELTKKLINSIEATGNLDVYREDPQQSVASLIQDSLGWSMDFYEMQLQNVITNRQRVEVVERLEPLGLHLFGNPAWRRLLSSNGKVMSALQPGPQIFDHSRLKDIYDHSKISINLPQHHVVPDAIQFRVVDIMSSKSLLVTKASKASDLYRFFGSDCPVPTYNTLEELEVLCRYFLTHEDERRGLVQACNDLVTEDFSFQQQCLTLLSICGLNPLTSDLATRRAAGRVEYINTDQFNH